MQTNSADGEGGAVAGNSFSITGGYVVPIEGQPIPGGTVVVAEGKIGHIGVTTEEPWTVIPFLEHEDVEVYQIAYNIIYQAAARHFLPEAAKVNAGVVTMRTMTSGIF